MNMIYLLNDTVADWMVEFFPAFRTVVVILMAIAAIISIVFIFLQINTGSDTTNAVTGGRESYYAQNKGSNKEGRTQKMVIICISLIVVLSILYFVSFAFYAGN